MNCATSLTSNTLYGNSIASNDAVVQTGHVGGGGGGNGNGDNTGGRGGETGDGIYEMCTSPSAGEWESIARLVLELLPVGRLHA